MIRIERQCATAAHWTEGQYRQAVQGEGVGRLVLVAELSTASASRSGSAGDVVGFLVAGALYYPLRRLAAHPSQSSDARPDATDTSDPDEAGIEAAAPMVT